MAGILAIAVLGVMIAGFRSSPRASISNLHLDSAVVHDLESNVTRLGAIDLPTHLDPQTARKVRDVITDAFLFGFRITMLICAVLAGASAAVAWRMIRADVKDY
jgi:hypothetical protein